jgi:hypothetical protein
MTTATWTKPQVNAPRRVFGTHTIPPAAQDQKIDYEADKTVETGYTADPA